MTLDNQNYDAKVPDVLSHYGPNLSDSDLEKMGADPFLIAAGLATKSTIVSKEGSKPTAQGANRKIPDICKSINVECISDFKLIKRLDFKIPL